MCPVRSRLFIILHATMLTESQADVGLNLFNFDVRRPGKPMHKYSMRLFDEIILAPYVSQGCYSK